MSTTHLTALTDSEAPLAGRRIPLILCIDDDPSISFTIEMQLRNHSVRVKQAFFGMQGFWEAVREAPDLILLDLAMPQGNGQFVLECLKDNQHSASIPVIVLTGSRDERQRTRAFQLGASQFLRKPIHFDELLREIGRFIDLRCHSGKRERSDPDGHRDAPASP